MPPSWEEYRRSFRMRVRHQPGGLPWLMETGPGWIPSAQGFRTWAEAMKAAARFQRRRWQ